MSLAGSLKTAGRVPVIAEVKFRSPSEGTLSEGKDVERIARAYERGGAAGISVLTEPEHFDGRLEYLATVRGAVSIPVLMKDIVVDRAQVDAAGKLAADAVLLIAGVFIGGMAESPLEEMVSRVHQRGLEAVVEVHNEEEYMRAVSGEADVVGINNRDLRTLAVSIDTSRKLLKLAPRPKAVICESGISTKDEIDSLRALGADGFLLGSVLMKSKDPEVTLRRLTKA